MTLVSRGRVVVGIPRRDEGKLDRVARLQPGYCTIGTWFSGERGAGTPTGPLVKRA